MLPQQGVQCSTVRCLVNDRTSQNPHDRGSPAFAHGCRVRAALFGSLEGFLEDSLAAWRGKQQITGGFVEPD